MKILFVLLIVSLMLCGCGRFSDALQHDPANEYTQTEGTIPSGETGTETVPSGETTICTSAPTKATDATDPEGLFWDKFRFSAMDLPYGGITDFESFRDAMDAYIALWDDTCGSFEIVFNVGETVAESDFADLKYMELSWAMYPTRVCTEVAFEDIDLELLQTYAQRDDIAIISICPPSRYVIADE